VAREVAEMVQHVQMVCAACQGKGSRIEAGGECRTCSGKCVVSERILLNGSIPRGAVDGERLIFPLQGGENNVVMVLRVAANGRAPVSSLKFTRIDNTSLVCSVRITVFKALTGGLVPVELVDGSVLELSIGDQVIQPGEIRVVRGCGLPDRNSGQSGDLFVHFAIAFPEKTVSPDSLPGLSVVTSDPLGNTTETPTGTQKPTTHLASLPMRTQQEILVQCRARGSELGVRGEVGEV
jgi:DnaJ homolog subfamily A member 2